MTSNLGKLILKEEMEKSLPIRRKTRSLPDRTPFHTCKGGAETPFMLPPPPPPPLRPLLSPPPPDHLFSPAALHMGGYKSSSLPASGRSTLTRVSGNTDPIAPGLGSGWWWHLRVWGWGGGGTSGFGVGVVVAPPGLGSGWWQH